MGFSTRREHEQRITERQRREPPRDSRDACVHPLEACHLFSLLSAALRKKKACRVKRWMRRSVFISEPFWGRRALSRHSRTSVNRLQMKSRGLFFVFFNTPKCRNVTAFLFMWRCFKKKKKKISTTIKSPFRSKFYSFLLQECVIFTFSDKSPCVSGMSVASNIARVVCNLIYLTRPSAPKAPNSTSPWCWNGIHS